MSSFPGNGFIPGPALPGVLTERLAAYKLVTIGNEIFFPGGVLVDGNNARDPSNAPYAYELLGGHLLGRITGVTGDVVTAGGNLYGSSIVGTLVNACTNSATSLTTQPAAAAEIVRRFGASGTFNLTGPPTAAGTVATAIITYSVVNQITGVITCSSTGTAFVAGSFIQPQDGSQLPITFVGNGYPLRVVNYDQIAVACPLAQAPIGGIVRTPNLENWPADTSLQTWVFAQLSVASGGKFIREDTYRS